MTSNWNQLVSSEQLCLVLDNFMQEEGDFRIVKVTFTMNVGSVKYVVLCALLYILLVMHKRR